MGAARSMVIVGAGIGGLAAAVVLAKQGWDVDVYDQAHKIDPVGAGIQLGPNAVRVLESIGLRDRISASAVETTGLTVRAGTNGRVLCDMPHGKAAIDRWGAPFLVIHRGDLQLALLAEAETLPNIRITLGRRLEELQAKEHGVRAVFSKYGDETPVDATALIGADGIWSKTRSFVGLTTPTGFSGCVAWRTTVPVDATPAWARQPVSNLWLGPGAHVVHYPIRGGALINIVAVVQDSWRERGWSEAGDIAWINRRFRTWHSDLGDLIGRAETWLRWSLFDRPPEWKWTRGTVALLGDAAHPMLPFMAQGASQALEDAKVLGDCLAAPGDVSAALLAYQNRRLARTARVQRAARAQNFAYHASGLAAGARNLVLSTLGGNGLARRYDWLYGEIV